MFSLLISSHLFLYLRQHFYIHNLASTNFTSFFSLSSHPSFFRSLPKRKKLSPFGNGRNSHFLFAHRLETSGTAFSFLHSLLYSFVQAMQLITFCFAFTRWSVKQPGTGQPHDRKQKKKTSPFGNGRNSHFPFAFVASFIRASIAADYLLLRHSQGGLLNSQGPDNPKTGRKKKSSPLGNGRNSHFLFADLLETGGTAISFLHSLFRFKANLQRFFNNERVFRKTNHDLVYTTHQTTQAALPAPLAWHQRSSLPRTR